ncbi:MAG: hypothetical protein ACKOAY_11255, partial [Haliscomenobacter sp.]
ISAKIIQIEGTSQQTPPHFPSNTTSPLYSTGNNPPWVIRSVFVTCVTTDRAATPYFCWK